MLTYQILGGPGRDNAVHVRIDSGQSVERVLFDCGEGCCVMIDDDVRETDLLLFSHFHLDHAAGFDSFFRANFDRPGKPVRVMGPPGTIRIMEHRLRGWLWNLHAEMSGSWRIGEWDGERTTQARLELQEAFAITHPEPGSEGPLLYDGEGFTLHGVLLEHHGPVVAAVFREKARRNMNTALMAELGLTPGPWVKLAKDAPDDTPVEVHGTTRSAAEWRALLLTKTPGDSLAILTDFLADESTISWLAEQLHGVRTLICESQYLSADEALAEEYHHMTSVRAAEIAKRAGVESLVLYHISSRYQEPEWRQILREAREVFPATSFPAHWRRLKD